jgi:hypothetical protein
LTIRAATGLADTPQITVAQTLAAGTIDPTNGNVSDNIISLSGYNNIFLVLNDGSGEGLNMVCNESNPGGKKVFAKLPLTSDVGQYVFYQSYQFPVFYYSYSKLKRLLSELQFSWYKRYDSTAQQLYNFRGLDNTLTFEIVACIDKTSAMKATNTDVNMIKSVRSGEQLDPVLEQILLDKEEDQLDLQNNTNIVEPINESNPNKQLPYDSSEFANKHEDNLIPKSEMDPPNYVKPIVEDNSNLNLVPDNEEGIIEEFENKEDSPEDNSLLYIAIGIGVIGIGGYFAYKKYFPKGAGLEEGGLPEVNPSSRKYKSFKSSSNYGYNHTRGFKPQ